MRDMASAINISLSPVVEYQGKIYLSYPLRRARNELQTMKVPRISKIRSERLSV